VLDPRERARLEKERELESDLRNARELLDSTTLQGAFAVTACDISSGRRFVLTYLRTPKGSSADADLDKILKSSPQSKEDFVALSDAIIAHIIKRHQDKPLYATFVEHHARALALPLRDVDVRKAATGLTTLANEKQREKTSGKKKPKSVGKPILGASKVGNKYVLGRRMYAFRADQFIF
jgi:translation initiation factor 3 subunit J